MLTVHPRLRTNGGVNDCIGRMVSSDMLGLRVNGVKAEKGDIRSYEVVIRNVRNMMLFATFIAIIRNYWVTLL